MQVQPPLILSGGVVTYCGIGRRVMPVRPSGPWFMPMRPSALQTRVRPSGADAFDFRCPQAPQCYYLAQFYRRRSFIYGKQPKATTREFRDGILSNEAPSICRPRLVACGQPWQGGGRWYMLRMVVCGGWWCVEDVRTMTMVVHDVVMVCAW